MSKICVFVKKKIHHWKKKRHTQNTHFPNQPARPSEPGPFYWEALLPYNSWRRKTCRAMKCLWRKRYVFVASWKRGETSFLFSFIFLDGRVFSHGFWKCWVGWETDSRCRVKLGKGGIYEQNHSDVADAKDFWKALRQLLQSESWSTAPCLQRTDQMWSHWQWW